MPLTLHHIEFTKSSSATTRPALCSATLLPGGASTDLVDALLEDSSWRRYETTAIAHLYGEQRGNREERRGASGCHPRCGEPPVTRGEHVDPSPGRPGGGLARVSDSSDGFMPVYQVSLRARPA